jgi:hypothetical protein
MRVADILGTGPGTRIAGAAIGIAGLAFIGLGTAGVGTITGGATLLATPIDCQTAPPTGACLHETSTQEGATAVSFGGNDCDFETRQATMDGFLFVLPAAEGTAFDSLSAQFDVGGVLHSYTGTVVISHPKFAFVAAPLGATLLEATAVVTGGPAGTPADGGSQATPPFFNLTGTCAGTGTTTSTTNTSSTTKTVTSPTTTTLTSPTTTTVTSPTTTTTTGAGGGLGVTTTSSSATSEVASVNVGGVAGISTTTPSTGADAQFGAGLGLLTIGGGVLFGSNRLNRKKRR